MTARGLIDKAVTLRTKSAASKLPISVHVSAQSQPFVKPSSSTGSYLLSIEERVARRLTPSAPDELRSRELFGRLYVPLPDGSTGGAPTPLHKPLEGLVGRLPVIAGDRAVQGVVNAALRAARQEQLLAVAPAVSIPGDGPTGLAHIMSGSLQVNPLRPAGDRGVYDELPVADDALRSYAARGSVARGALDSWAWGERVKPTTKGRGLPIGGLDQSATTAAQPTRRAVSVAMDKAHVQEMTPGISISSPIVVVGLLVLGAYALWRFGR